MRARTYRVVMSATCHHALRRALRRALRPEHHPQGPRLTLGRLETLDDALALAEPRPRAAWLTATERTLSTLDAFVAHCEREGWPIPGSARSLARRARWRMGIDG